MTPIVDDALWSLIWGGATYAVVAAGLRAARRAFPGDSAAQVALHASVATVALIVFELTWLGAIGGLARGAILAGAGVLSLGLRRAAFRPSAANAAAPDRSWAVLAWAPVLAILLGHVALNGLMELPTDFDCLMYHLPLIDQWLQTGSLAATLIARWSDPANSELLGLWFATPFSGDFLVALNNVPVMIVWATGLLELLRLLDVTGWLRHGAAIACLAVHTTVHETDNASNDLMVAAFFIAAVVYALRYVRSSAASDLALFGASLGLLAGTKYFAIGYALLAAVVFAWGCGRAQGWWRAVRGAIVAGGIALALGGYWYARNVIVTGYPFYPQGSPALHERIVHPDMRKTTLAFNGDPAVPGLALAAVWKFCGPIQLAAVLLFPAIAVAAVVIGVQGMIQNRRENLARAALPILLLGALAITLVTPMLVEHRPGTLNHLRWGYTPVRYSLCFLCLLVAATAVVLQTALDRVGTRLTAAAGVILCVAAVGQFVYRFSSRTEIDFLVTLSGGANLLCAAFGAGWVARNGRRGRAVVLVLAVVMGSTTAGLLSRRWHAAYAWHFDRYFHTHMFTDLAAGGPQRLLVLDERPYPYLGSRRQNLVEQPLSYRGMTAVKEAMTAATLSFVATHAMARNETTRFGGAAEDLKADAAFELVGPDEPLVLFRYIPGKR